MTAPSNQLPWPLDGKWCYIRMEGTTFGDFPLNAEVKLEVWDSPNSSGVVIDAIRSCNSRSIGASPGPSPGPSARQMSRRRRSLPTMWSTTWWRSL